MKSERRNVTRYIVKDNEFHIFNHGSKIAGKHIDISKGGLAYLNRRSQRLSYNWAGFEDLLNQFLMPAPKITEKYPSKQLKLFV